MLKKYEISIEAQVLLKLLRIALGTEPMSADGRPMEPFPSDINWREVIRLSYDQKVSSIAVDGLKASGYDPREGKSGHQLEDLNAVLKHWFDDVKNSEESYAYYLTVLSTLCQIFSANGLKPVILKGYGLSKNYPIPSHRGAGDIDIYLLDEEGKPAAEKGDDLIQKMFGISWTQDEVDLHSQFNFKGIIVENHHAFVGHPWGYSDRDILESFFEGEIDKGIVEKEGLCFPSTFFNSAFLIKHMFAHFGNNRMSLRQLCDYSLFVKNHSSEIDWSQVRIFCGQNGFTDFASGIHSLLRQNFKDDNCPILCRENAEWAKHILYDTFYFQEIRRSFFGKITMYLRNSWHCRKFLKRNWLYLTLKKGTGYLLSSRTHAACSRKSA